MTRPSSHCCKAGICTTAPAPLLQTDLCPVSVPAVRPLAPPEPRDDAWVQRAQASADVRGWGTVSEVQGWPPAMGPPCCSPLLQPQRPVPYGGCCSRAGWARLWVLRAPRLTRPRSLPPPRVVSIES